MGIDIDIRIEMRGDKIDIDLNELTRGDTEVCKPYYYHENNNTLQTKNVGKRVPRSKTKMEGSSNAS